MFVAVDFDGTIVTHEYPDIGRPVPGAVEWMKQWQDAGASLILWTMRSDTGPDGPVLEDAVRYLADNGIALAGQNENPTQRTWTTSPKAYAQIYVDDAAFGCPLVEVEGERPYVDWSIVGPAVLEMITARDKNRKTA